MQSIYSFSAARQLTQGVASSVGLLVLILLCSFALAPSPLRVWSFTGIVVFALFLFFAVNEAALKTPNQVPRSSLYSPVFLQKRSWFHCLILNAGLLSRELLWPLLTSSQCQIVISGSTNIFLEEYRSKSAIAIGLLIYALALAIWTVFDYIILNRFLALAVELSDHPTRNSPSGGFDHLRNVYFWALTILAGLFFLPIFFQNLQLPAQSLADILLIFALANFWGLVDLGFDPLLVWTPLFLGLFCALVLEIETAKCEEIWILLLIRIPIQAFGGILSVVRNIHDLLRFDEIRSADALAAFLFFAVLVVSSQLTQTFFLVLVFWFSFWLYERKLKEKWPLFNIVSTLLYSVNRMIGPISRL